MLLRHSCKIGVFYLASWIERSGHHLHSSEMYIMPSICSA